MKISYEQIEQLKQYNLPELLRDYGLRCASGNNGSYSFFCPFHQDTDPSLKVNLKGSKWLWHCFGCNTGGNVINFVMRYEKLSLPQACQKLLTLNGKYLLEKPVTSNQAPETESAPSPQAQKLLNRVVAFYHSCLYEDRKALNYLVSRGIRDQDIFKTFKIGYVNGTLHRALPQEGEVIEELKELGILTKNLKEHFLGCCIFPVFDQHDNCVEIYGRRISDRSPKHLYLKGAHKGVFNYHTARTHPSLILTEGIIDCLSLYQAGFKNCIPLYGTGGLTPDHLSLFKDNHVTELYLCLDGDSAGRSAAIKLKLTFEQLGLKSSIIELPEGLDPNAYLRAHQPSDFEKLLNQARPKQPPPGENTVKEPAEAIQALADGLSLQYGERAYLIRGIDHARHQRLKVNIKAQSQKGRFHIDTLELYSARQRAGFAKEASLLFGQEPEVITHDLNRIIEKTESYLQAKSLSEDKPQVIPDQEKEEALRFLRRPDLFAQIIKDLEQIGCVGENTNKLTVYLAAVSRRLDEPLSLLILSRSAAGKSLLQESVLELVPKEDKAKYTRITGQALFYKGEDSLKNKVLSIEEEEGANQAAYSIRTMQSSRLLTIATTIKDPLTGQMKTQEYQVKGPLSIILTTSRSDLDYETMNRFILLSVDESREQTRLIHKFQREKQTLKGLLESDKKTALLRKHHNAQRLLRPLKVVNPYAELLSFRDDRLRARRDHQKYLNLIKAVTFLFQYQRPIKEIIHQERTIEYIEVTLEDIVLANRIAHEVLGKSLDELSPPARKLLFIIRQMVSAQAKHERKQPQEITFSRRDIREYAGWSDHQLRHHLRQLVDLEYVLTLSGRNGLRFVYQLAYTGGGEDGEKLFIGLTEVEDLKKRLNLTAQGAGLGPPSAQLAHSLRPPCGNLADQPQEELV